MQSLDVIAPAFVEMAHRIVWCIAATTGQDGRPSTRVLHPIWQWDDGALEGWILTSPRSPKADDLRSSPALSLTYWAPNHDTCTADCDASSRTAPTLVAPGGIVSPTARRRSATTPSIIPAWTDADAPEFGVLRLMPTRLRVMPGTVMTAGTGRPAHVAVVT